MRPASDDHDRPVRHRSHKDTRRWCKGVPGREHQPEVAETTWGYAPWWSLSFADKCTQCGKQMNEFRVWLWQPEWHRRLVDRMGGR